MLAWADAEVTLLRVSLLLDLGSTLNASHQRLLLHTLLHETRKSP